MPGVRQRAVLGRMAGGLTLCLVALCLLSGAARGDVDVDKLPKPTGYVSDLANVVDAGQKAQLEAFCYKVEQQLGGAVCAGDGG